MLAKTLALFLVFYSTFAGARPTVCIPPNRFKFPPGHRLANAMTQAEFDGILARLERLHSPYFTAQGAELRIDADWDDGTVNAFADRDGATFIIEIFGGLARYPALTRDGFTLLACHELGHHLGGAPSASRSGWPSMEGQADYFATLKCLRRIFAGEDNEGALRGQKPDPSVVRRCEKAFTERDERLICVRAALAGLSAARFFRSLDPKGPPPDFATPDPRVVTKTDPSHPEPQCRLDTYFAGASCPADPRPNPGQKDPTRDVCAQGREADGFRPRCWFHPGVSAARPRGGGPL